MSKDWTDPWKMAGTEGAFEYLVLCHTTRGRLGVRVLQGGKKCRIRVEPRKGKKLELSQGWKQPGQGGQNRYSIVSGTEVATDACLDALLAIGADISKCNVCWNPDEGARQVQENLEAQYLEQ